MERKYIADLNTLVPNGYNLTAGGERCQWDANPGAILTYEDVMDIRDMYALRRFAPRDVYKRYADIISYTAFMKVWEGSVWRGIHMDVYTPENLHFYKTVTVAGKGEENSCHILSDDEVLKARIFYMNHTLHETYEKYGSQYKTERSFACTLMKRYVHLPIYHKRSKQWTLGNEVITFNPVTTIPESGE